MNRLVVLLARQRSTLTAVATLCTVASFGIACRGAEPIPSPPAVTGDLNAAVSPDGAWVVFDHLDSIGLPSLYRARLDGTERQLLLVGSFGGDWSPDGSKLAANQGGSIVTIALPTGDVSDIAEGNGPTFSPDGATLAFSSVGPFSGPPDLWTVPAAGGTATRVPLPGPPRNELRQPDWAPDGARLVAARAGGTFALFLTRLDGTDTSVIMIPDRDLTHPAWSPLGNRLVYVRSDGTANEIWLVNPDGSAHKRIAADGSHPQWFQDGSRLVITRRLGTQLSLWTVDTLGQNLTSLWGSP